MGVVDIVAVDEDVLVLVVVVLALVLVDVVLLELEDVDVSGMPKSSSVALVLFPLLEEFPSSSKYRG
jgi:hypothetical protein